LLVVHLLPVQSLLVLSLLVDCQSVILKRQFAALYLFVVFSMFQT